MKMIRMLFVLLTATHANLVLAQETIPSGATQEKPSELGTLSPDLEAIRAGSEAFVAAFNAKDAKAVAALWIEDGEYTDDSGRSFVGREAIEKGYAAFFADNTSATIRIEIDSLRSLGSSNAIEDGRSLVEFTPGGSQVLSTYTAVHVKVDGKWLMASVRDFRVATSSAQDSVSDLEFLIGTWVAEEFGNRSESVCRWVAEKSFVERTYTTTFRDGTQTSGVQIIGWNPEAGHLQSWDFSPGGGHAVGVLTPVEDGWRSEVRGYGSDGTPTTSVNLLKRLDENAYVWQSLQRTAGDVALPDTGEVILKRQPNNR